jgi:hypothetical protein
MPGLLRGVARTAVVAGTASAVAGRVNHHQQEKWAAQGQAQYAQPQYAQPQYAQPQYAQPQYAQPQYVEPAPVYTPPAPAPAAAPEVDRIEQLKQLGELHTQGILTDAEFAAEKAKLLGS